MPHISKRKLHPEISRKIFKELITIFEKITRRQGAYTIIFELFTRTEKIMFAKRIATVLLLANNFPQHRIEDILKISPTTVSKFSLRLEKGWYGEILKSSAEEKMDIERLVRNIMKLDRNEKVT